MTGEQYLNTRHVLAINNALTGVHAAALRGIEFHHHIDLQGMFTNNKPHSRGEA
jgi:hypothetical protein